MKFFISGFTIKDVCLIIPSLALRMMRCEDPDCCRLHGVCLELAWFEWGFAFGFLIPFDDLT